MLGYTLRNLEAGKVINKKLYLPKKLFALI